MKIQCDVCNKDEASVFCSADEAALCASCDHRVHHANKLAVKHQRFSLLLPSPKQFPLCDICQERKAFLFCQQDRAILCRDCDIPIHRANEHTQKHNRFLLTGVKLSATSTLYSPPSAAASATGCPDSVPDLKKSQKPLSVILNPPSSITTQVASDQQNQLVSGGVVEVGVGPTSSSISEYLTETLPGWHVEDFLDYSTPAPSFGFSKNVDENVMGFWDSDLESNMSPFTTENMGIWVPQAPDITPQNQYSQLNTSSNMGFDGQTGFMEYKEATTKIKSSKKLREDCCFTVPQINPSSKRARNVW
ncbi:B-box zinc finger protein 21-like [Cornus florida]|uniref:B-box zinc finger protein 21-like n=1 Tax=Cornus florida TaxID=4283 RepID=UPI0028A2D85E|nr:B-box zinc finger protein 21-like [Cornus florida]